MGSRLVKYEFCPKENEQIDAVIKVPEETRSVIHGVVIDCKNKPIKDAVVKLLEVVPGNPCLMKPLVHAFTDECGQFLIGPLQPHKKYALKVWFWDIKIKELIISADCNEPCGDHFEDQCDEHHEDHCSYPYDESCDNDHYEKRDCNYYKESKERTMNNRSGRYEYQIKNIKEFEDIEK